MENANVVIDPVIELTDEQVLEQERAKIAEANDAKIRELERGISAAKKGMMDARKTEDVMAHYQKRVNLEKELEAFLISIRSPEEQRAYEAMLEAELAYEDAKKAYDDAKAELAKYKPEFAKKEVKKRDGTVSGNPPKNPTGQTARIIELAKQGLSNKEIGIELGYTKEQGYGNGTISPIAKHYR